MDSYNIVGSWDSFSMNLGCVLHGWRVNRGYSLDDVAEFEGLSRDSLAEVERGCGSMCMLLRFIDFIRCKEPSFLACIIPAWINMCGYSVNSL